MFFNCNPVILCVIHCLISKGLFFFLNNTKKQRGFIYPLPPLLLYQMVLNSSKWPQIVQMVSIGPNWSRIVPNGSKWSQMNPNGPTWSQIVMYKLFFSIFPELEATLVKCTNFQSIAKQGFFLPKKNYVIVLNKCTPKY